MDSRFRIAFLFVVYVTLLLTFARFIYEVCGESCLIPSQKELILDLALYNDTPLETTKEVLLHRIKAQPYNLIATIIFVCAIVHTFFAHYFTVLSKKLRDKNIREGKEVVDSFMVEILKFMGEVEVVFGIWVIPLFVSMTYFYNWKIAIHYFDQIKYIEPMFVVVIMALTATRPIIQFAEESLTVVAKLGGETTKAWWWSLLTVGPICGSLITEPGAMTIAALLLGRKFYELRPSPRFAYATLGLLFTNISVGGVLTNFAAPPVLIVSQKWNWNTPYMAGHFGWKAVLGIVLSNVIYYLIFKKEFEVLEKRNQQRKKEKVEAITGKSVPLWISVVHIVFLAWTVVHNHYPVIFIGSFLLFLGFHQATLQYQKEMNLKPPVLVGFFLAGLVVHGSMQAWWIEPVLGKASEEVLIVLSTFLTSFNDNAEITFLATLIPNFTESMKYAVVAGAVTGGGLTVIANAPNPSGQAVLGRYFYQGISAVGLLLGALVPTFIMGMVFYLFRHV